MTARTVRSRGRRGVAAIEFALTLPIYLTIVFAVVELALVLRQQLRVAHAAADGALAGAMIVESGTPTGATIETVAEDHALRVLQAEGVCLSGCTVTATWALASGARWVDVEITAPYTPLSALPWAPVSTVGQFSAYARQQD